MGEKSEVIIPLGGILDITGEVIAMWVLLALITVLSILATRNMKERPGTFQNLVETGVEYLDNFFTGIKSFIYFRNIIFSKQIICVKNTKCIIVFFHIKNFIKSPF